MLKKFDILILSIISTLVSIISIAFFYMRDEILLYGDARSHVNIPREVFDNLTPGVAQFGGVWPFLFHILELPFVWNDFLWQTGLAGSIVSGIAFVGSSIYVYKFVKDITKVRLAAFFAFLAYILNPNLLYMQSIPMTELWMSFSFIGSVYYFYKWLKSDSVNSLLLSAFFVFLGTWVRYDAWFLVIVEILTIGLWSIYKGKIKDLTGKIALFSYVGLIGIFLWIVWNYLIFGDPLYFLFGAGVSAHAQQQDLEAIGRLPAKHNLVISVLTYLWDCLDMAGIVSIILSFISFIIYTAKNKITPATIALGLFLSLFVFNVISLFLGFTALFIPEVNPGIAIWNVRYGLTILFFVSITPFLLFPKKTILNLVILLVLVSNSLFLVMTHNVITYNEGLYGNGTFNKKDIPLALWFKQNYNGGRVLISFVPNNTLAQAIGLPMKIYVHEGTREYWQRAMDDPKDQVEWIITDKGDRIFKKFSSENKFKDFDKAFESEDVIVYRVKNKVVQ